MIEISAIIEPKKTHDNRLILHVYPEDAWRLREYLNAKEIKADTRLSITIAKWKTRRSLKQKGLFYIIVGEMAKKTGMDIESIKRGLKEKYGVKKIVEHDNKIYVHIKSTEEYNMAEMRELLEGTVMEAAEQGIDLSPWLKDIQGQGARNEISENPK